MRRFAVVVALLVAVGSFGAALADKPAPSTAKKPANSTSAAKKPAPGPTPRSVGILGTISSGTQLTLRFGTPTVKGALDRKTVAAVVKRSKSKLLACAKESLDTDDERSRTVTARFTIGADGKVRSGTATGLDERTRTCITSALATLRFAVAKADQGTKVSYPLIFKSETVTFSSLTGTGDISGLDEATVYGGLLGSEIGEGGGYGGLGARGTGQGGGGTGVGTIGLGNVGTIGHGSGTGSGYGARRPVPTMSIGQGSATGQLDKAIIRRYIKRNIGKIQYCYERELVKNHELRGTVTASFTIGADGHVSSSTASGMGDKNVESCLAKVIAAIQFPQPKSGAVVVRYPFTFRSASTGKDAAKAPTADAAKK